MKKETMAQVFSCEFKRLINVTKNFFNDGTRKAVMVLKKFVNDATEVSLMMEIKMVGS